MVLPCLSNQQQHLPDRWDVKRNKPVVVPHVSGYLIVACTNNANLRVCVCTCAISIQLLNKIKMAIVIIMDTWFPSVNRNQFTSVWSNNFLHRQSTLSLHSIIVVVAIVSAPSAPSVHCCSCVCLLILHSVIACSTAILHTPTHSHTHSE